MIMGIGMLSLATLFPLGLSRLREASRNTRSALLIETATGEVSSRDLLYKPSFLPFRGYDAFTQDPASVADITAGTVGINRRVTGGAGVPICYDPLWWYEVAQSSGGTVVPSLVAGSEYRFASGIDLMGNDPSGGAPSAHGLQRITNFPITLDPASVMCSPDDPVMQTDGTGAPGRGSPIVPDLSTAGMMRDYMFSWIFTGKQTDSSNGTIFDGDIVIFHNRPFATEEVQGVSGSAVKRAAGETVVEAIWGYGNTTSAATFPYVPGESRKVLLRWPNTQADPDVRKGGWIADVTYERYSATENSRWYDSAAGWTTYYPAQRCYWYRVAKKTEAVADPDANHVGYRQMVVTLSSPVRVKTPIDASGAATRTNACLVSPYVVNVVSRVFYTR